MRSRSSLGFTRSSGSTSYREPVNDSPQSVYTLRQYKASLASQSYNNMLRLEETATKQSLTTTPRKTSTSTPRPAQRLVESNRPSSARPATAPAPVSAPTHASPDKVMDSAVSTGGNGRQKETFMGFGNRSFKSAALAIEVKLAERLLQLDAEFNDADPVYERELLKTQLSSRDFDFEEEYHKPKEEAIVSDATELNDVGEYPFRPIDKPASRIPANMKNKLREVYMEALDEIIKHDTHFAPLLIRIRDALASVNASASDTNNDDISERSDDQSDESLLTQAKLQHEITMLNTRLVEREREIRKLKERNSTLSRKLREASEETNMLSENIFSLSKQAAIQHDVNRRIQDIESSVKKDSKPEIEQPASIQNNDDEQKEPSVESQRRYELEAEMSMLRIREVEIVKELKRLYGTVNGPPRRLEKRTGRHTNSTMSIDSLATYSQHHGGGFMSTAHSSALTSRAHSPTESLFSSHCERTNDDAYSSMSDRRSTPRHSQYIGINSYLDKLVSTESTSQHQLTVGAAGSRANPNRLRVSPTPHTPHSNVTESMLDNGWFTDFRAVVDLG